MKKTTILLGVAMALLTAGCMQEPQEEVRTVEYYKENRGVMEETLTKCNNNPGVLDNDPNCINANTAYAQTLMQLNYQPLPPDHKSKY